MMRSIASLAVVASTILSLVGHTAAQCNPSDRTYSTEQMPNGTYMSWSYINAPNSVPGSRQYVTIVNMTPHRFNLTSTHSYQMDTFDFGDIPQGHSRQNTVVYTSKVGADDVDDGGEAYYSIDGTDKTFAIQIRTHIPDDNPARTVFDLTGMGLGQREYLDPANEVPVTLVITGSETYGFITNIQFGAANWMKGIYSTIKDRQIQHVAMPGSHDSGMSVISDEIVSIGSSANTQTQGLNIYNQLKVGARYFDLRVASIHDNTNTSDYSLYTLHVNDELSDVPVGNSGQSLDDVIANINQFTSESPGEVIFFHVRYMVGIRHIPSFGPIYWTTDIVNNFFGKLKGVNNRCGNLDTSTTFNSKTAGYFMDQNNGNGCVIFLLAGDLHPDVPQNSPADGLYPAGQLSITDDWSNLPDTEPMANDQTTKWRGVTRPGNSDIFHINQWLVSADAITTTADSIQGIGIFPTNPALYWMGVNYLSPESWPTVMLQDYLGVVVWNQFSWNQLSADLVTLAIGMNLYLISENCDVSDIRSPLLPALGSGLALSSKEKNTVQTFRGIHYANGTIDSNPPKGFHPGRVPVLKTGTKFSNGTVLKHDTPNPYYHSTLL